MRTNQKLLKKTKDDKKKLLDDLLERHEELLVEKEHANAAYVAAQKVFDEAQEKLNAASDEKESVESLLSDTIEEIRKARTEYCQETLLATADVFANEKYEHRPFGKSPGGVLNSHLSLKQIRERLGCPDELSIKRLTKRQCCGKLNIMHKFGLKTQPEFEGLWNIPLCCDLRTW